MTRAGLKLVAAASGFHSSLEMENIQTLCTKIENFANLIKQKDVQIAALTKSLAESEGKYKEARK